MAEPVYLRALELNDLENTYQWHNSPELYRWLAGTIHHVGREVERQWLEQRCKHSDREVNLAVCVTGSDEHIGNLYLRNIDWVHRRAELHIFIGDSEKRSCGFGTSALRQLLQYAFENLNLRRVHLSVLEENLAARRIYEKCGFTVEGVLSQHVYKNGHYHNVVLMGLTRAP